MILCLMSGGLDGDLWGDCKGVFIHIRFYVDSCIWLFFWNVIWID